MIGIDIVAIRRIEENLQKYGEVFLKKIPLTQRNPPYKNLIRL